MEQRRNLSRRAMAMLRAVSAGRAEMTCSSEPDLFIDGVPCCDQVTAHLLAHAGFVCPSRPGLPGQRVGVRLAEAGREILAAPPEAA